MFPLSSTSKWCLATATVLSLGIAGISTADAATTAVPKGMTATITPPSCGDVVAISLRNKTSSEKRFRLRAPDSSDAFSWVTLPAGASTLVQRKVTSTTQAVTWSVRYESARIVSKSVTAKPSCYNGVQIPYVGKGMTAAITPSCGPKAIITVHDDTATSFPKMEVFRDRSKKSVLSTNVGQGTTYALTVPMTSAASNDFVVKANGKTIASQTITKLKTCETRRNIDWGKPVFTDDFSGKAVDTSKWWVYDSDNYPPRDPSLVSVAGGVLRLPGKWDAANQRSVGSGIGFRKGQMYGHWEMRVRHQVGPGYRSAFLLWPDNEKWPENGEIDIAEIFGSKRNQLDHYLHNGPDNRHVGRNFALDMTQWHVIGVDWLPDRVTYWVDGQETWTVPYEAPADGFNFVPRGGPMHMALQNDVSGGCRKGECTGYNKKAAVTVQVDWVKQWALPAK